MFPSTHLAVQHTRYVMPRALLLRLADELPEDLRALHATCRGASPVVSARAAEVLAAMAAARDRAREASLAVTAAAAASPGPPATHTRLAGDDDDEK
eukprot:406308-Prorocentrum_minimum.AAC.1